MSASVSPKESVLAALREVLKAPGFKKRGAVFHRASMDVVHLVGLQSSASSTIHATKVTVNLAVWCKRLADPGVEPSVMTAHWRCRLGELMPLHSDAWWSLPGKGAAALAENEITSALKAYGIPALDALQDCASLLALWDAGRSPGLTKIQALRYSEILRASVV